MLCSVEVPLRLIKLAYEVGLQGREEKVGSEHPLVRNFRITKDTWLSCPFSSWSREKEAFAIDGMGGRVARVETRPYGRRLDIQIGQTGSTAKGGGR